MKNILLQKDYNYLVDRVEEINSETKRLAKKLGAAAAHGGSFQIPEYQSIEDRLRAINERSETIRKVIADSTVVPFEKINDKLVGFYCLVKVEDQDTGSQEYFYIIHPELADNIKLVDNTMPVSPSSPVGQALMNKKTGNIVKIKLSKSTKTLKIIHFEKKEL